MSRLFDLSHPIEAGMFTHPGRPDLGGVPHPGAARQFRRRDPATGRQR